MRHVNDETAAVADGTDEQAGDPGVPRPGRTHRWPTYLVSAPHGVACAFGAPHPALPYAEWHARRVGSLQSVCGRSAVTWRFFWTLDFREAGGRACPACLAALRDGVDG